MSGSCAVCLSGPGFLALCIASSRSIHAVAGVGIPLLLKAEEQSSVYTRTLLILSPAGGRWALGLCSHFGCVDKPAVCTAMRMSVPGLVVDSLTQEWYC